MAALLREPGVKIEDFGVLDRTPDKRPLVRVRMADGRLAEISCCRKVSDQVEAEDEAVVVRSSERE